MNSLAQVRDLSKQYDPPNGVLAVDGVSFDIHEGEIFGLLGPNGAGKTTTISMLSCLLKPTGGDATVDGHSRPRADGSQKGHWPWSRSFLPFRWPLSVWGFCSPPAIPAL